MKNPIHPQLTGIRLTRRIPSPPFGAFRLRRVLQSLATAALMFHLAAAVSSARESNPVIIGNIAENGSVSNSATNLGPAARVTSELVHEGRYRVTVTAPGAFSDVEGWTVEATIREHDSGDTVIWSSTPPKTDDQITVDFLIGDVEDSANRAIAAPDYAPFQFVIHGFSLEVPSSGASPFLIATGKARADGTLESGVGVDGIGLAGERVSTGHYRLTLDKPGAFAGDRSRDYVLILTPEFTSASDTVIRGFAETDDGDDRTHFSIFTDDAQTDLDDNTPLPVSQSYYFSIYRIPKDPAALTGPAESMLALAKMRVNSSSQLRERQSIPGSRIEFERVERGLYRVGLLAPGLFAGRKPSDFVIQLTPYRHVFADEIAIGRIESLDPGGLAIRVAIFDVETTTRYVGSPSDLGFYLSVYAAWPEHQPDLRIGRSRPAITHRGNDIYNATGAGQKERVLLRHTRRQKYFFSLENDGNLSDDHLLTAGRPRGGIKLRYYRLFGGRENVTAQISTVGRTEEGVAPKGVRLFQAQAQNRGKNRRRARNAPVTSVSTADATRRDAVTAKLKPKK